MYYWIASGVMIALMAIAVFCGVMKGRKYAWEYAALRLANVIISAVAAVFVSALLGKILGGFVSQELMKAMPVSMSAALNEMPAVSGLIGAFVAMLAAPIIFYILFAIIRGVISLFVPSIAYKVKKHEGEERYDENGKKLSKKKLLKNNKGGILGMLLGGACALCMFIVLAAPLTTYLTIGNGVMMMVGGGSENKVLSTVSEVTDAVSDNLGTKAVKFLGGDLLVSGMTSYEIDGQKSNLLKETGIINSVGEAVSAVRDNSCDAAESANAVRESANSFDKTVFVSSATAEFLDCASGSWNEGKDFAGIKPFSIGGSDGLSKEIYQTFDGSTTDTVKKDVHTVANILACIVEEDAFDEIKGNFVSVLENEEITQKILFELLDNDHLEGMVGGFMNYGVEVLCNSLEVRHDMNGIYDDFLADLANIDAGTDPVDEAAVSKAQTEYKNLFAKYAIKVSDDCPKNAAIADASGTDMSAWVKEQGIVTSAEDMVQKSKLVTTVDIDLKGHAITDKAAEAVKLAKALHSVITLSNEVKGESDTAKSVIKLGPVLDAFSETETVGRDCTSELLVAILQSEKVGKSVGFNHLQATDIADSINSGAKTGGYVAQMTTLGQTFDVLQVVSNKGDSKAAVSSLLKDLTPESAKTMQTVTTPEVMKENGVPEKSAEPASSMMSDMFGGLSDAKEQGMSEEELDKETAAVNNVLNTAMNIDTNNEKVFGEESATGVTADTFVNDMMDSKVVSQTIIDHVYGEGDTPKLDPLNSERQMNDAETEELMTALNAKWQNASAEEKADAQFNKSIVAIAALVNVPVNVTANGVVRA